MAKNGAIPRTVDTYGDVCIAHQYLCSARGMNHAWMRQLLPADGAC